MDSGKKPRYTSPQMYADELCLDKPLVRFPDSALSTNSALVDNTVGFDRSE